MTIWKVRAIVADPAGDFVNGLASAVALVGETFEDVGLPGLLPCADAVTAEGNVAP